MAKQPTAQPMRAHAAPKIISSSFRQLSLPTNHQAIPTNLNFNTDVIKILRLAISSLISVALTACAVGPSRVDSNKASGYSKEAKRVFVITDAGTDFGVDYADSSSKKFRFLAKECGIAMEISRRATLELDATVRVKKMLAFGPDALLYITRNGGTQSQAGLIHVIYDVRLADMTEKNNLVWRANVSFYRGGLGVSLTERGEALATELANKMKTDGVFGSCKASAAKVSSSLSGAKQSITISTAKSPLSVEKSEAAMLMTTSHKSALFYS